MYLEAFLSGLNHLNLPEMMLVICGVVPTPSISSLRGACIRELRGYERLIFGMWEKPMKIEDTELGQAEPTWGRESRNPESTQYNLHHWLMNTIPIILHTYASGILFIFISFDETQLDLSTRKMGNYLLLTLSTCKNKIISFSKHEL